MMGLTLGQLTLLRSFLRDMESESRASMMATEDSEIMGYWKGQEDAYELVLWELEKLASTAGGVP